MSENPVKRRKQPIKFGVTLNEEQKEAKSIILNNEITIIRGNAGSGKTLLACQCALDGFFTKQYDKIIIARPAVTNDEDLGHLPGDKDSKLLEFMFPILDNFKELYGHHKDKREKIEKHLIEEEIQIVPVGHLRGRTFKNAFVIIDEAQNLTVKQMEMIVTRLGMKSKMVITGDLRQQDLKSNSGMDKLLSLVEKVNSLASVELSANHRSGIVQEILSQWE